MNPLISVIMPLFNVEQYLLEALNSIQNQSYKNIEIILVNDGSTDYTKTICEEFVKKEGRAKLINTVNKGVSSARNTGIEHSTGDYLIFFDPDDLVEPQMIEELYKQITFFQTDIACCSYTKDKKRILSSQVERNKVSVVLSPKESLSLILEEQYFKGFVWNKLFSKSTLSFPKKILFDETIQYCEDLLFCCQAFSQSKKISYENKELYHYFVNDNSISKNNFSSKKITSLTALKKVIFLIDNDDLKCKQKFETYYINMALSLLMHGIESKEITKSEKEKLLDSLYSIKLSNIKNIKIKLFCLLSRLNVNLSYTTWKLLKN